MMKRAVFAILLAVPAVYAQEAAPAAESGRSTWTWIDFAILIVAMAFLIGKTLPAFFRRRTQDIQKGIAEAQKIKASAEERAARVEARIAHLGTEIEKFRVEAHVEMEREGERIRAESAKQIERRQEQAEQEIETAGKLARRDLQAYAAKLALELAEQRIRGRLDAQSDGALVNEFVRDLQRSQN